MLMVVQMEVVKEDYQLLNIRFNINDKLMQLIERLIKMNLYNKLYYDLFLKEEMMIMKLML